MFEHNNLNLRVYFNLKDISRVGGNRSQIWLSTTIKGERVRIYTRQLVRSEYWIKCNRSEIGGGYVREDNSLGRVINKENKAINKALNLIIGYCDDYIKQVSAVDGLQTTKSYCLDYSPTVFKEYIESRISGNDYLKKNNAEDFITDYITRKKEEVNINTGRKIGAGTLYNHKNALNRLKQFAEEKHISITWDLFNKDLERPFTAWMASKGYTPNTIASEFSIIKVWLSDAERRNLIEDRAFHHYHTATHDVENIYLTEEEIKKLYELDLSDMIENGQSKIEETRDLFVIGCWTGLRYSDYGSLPEIDEERDIIEVRTHKTDKTVVIPLHPIVKAIYHKYNGKLPKPIDRGKAMDHIRRCAKKAGINSRVTLNKTKGGRVVSLIKEKWQFIMNHTARRSFATNMYLKGVKTISIMSITGHTTETNFMKYIKVDGEQHARIVARAFVDE